MLDHVLDLAADVPPWLLVLLGLALLLAGARWLVDGSVGLARSIGISPLFIGLTIVACGTSAPELVVNVIAALNDNPGLSFGNVIGSNIANIGLVVGFGALVAPLDVHSRIISRELPWMIGATILTVVLMILPWRSDSGGVGPSAWALSGLDGLMLLTGFGCFLLVWLRASLRRAPDPFVGEVTAEASRHDVHSPVRAGLLLLVGLAVLLVGGRMTEHGAVGLARTLGLSDAVIGMTVIAVATSLPELFTVIVAVRRGQSDLAVGNVVGSNIFNLLLVLGVTSCVVRVPVPYPNGIQDLAAMLILSVLLLVVAHTRQRSISRLEGILLLGLYAGYMAWSVLREMLE